MTERKIYYVDVANAGKKNKLHAVFDGKMVFKVRRLMELEDADEIYVDMLFPENYSEVLKMLEKDIKIFLLTETKLIKKLRVQNNVRKTDENDSKVLSLISKECFRNVSVEEIRRRMEMQPLIAKYEVLTRRIKTLKQWLKDGQTSEEIRKEIVKTSREFEKERSKIGREIISVLGENYRKILEKIGLRGSVEAAILLTYLDLSRGINKLLTYCWRSRKVNEHLSKLVYSIYRHYLRGDAVPEAYRKFIEESRGKLSRRQLLVRLKRMVIKDLRRAYIELSMKSASQVSAYGTGGNEPQTARATDASIVSLKNL